MKLLMFISTIMVCLIVAGGSRPAQAAPTADELLADSYLSEQASRRMEQFVPKGEYTLLISSSLKPEANSERITLPFSRSPINLSEHLGKNPTSIESILGRIKKLDITLSVSKDVPSSVRELMKAALEKQFSINSTRGDRLIINDLPSDFGLAWLEDSKAKDESISWIHTAAIVVGLMASILLLGWMIQAISKGHSNRLANSMKEAANQVGDSAPVAPMMPQATAPTGPTAFSGGGAPAAGAYSQQTSEEFWADIHPNVVHAFVIDLCESKIYGSMTSQLIHSELPQSLSEAVRSLLPKSVADFPIDESAQLVDAGVIRSVFKKYLGEYKRLSQHPLGSALIRVGIRQITSTMKSRNETEVLLMMSYLSPIRKAEVIRQLDSEQKIRLAKQTLKFKGNETWMELEQPIISALVRLESHYDLVGAKSSLEQITRNLLQANSFEEDQALFESLADQTGLQFESALGAIKQWTAEDWSTQNLQTIALAFSGYPESVTQNIERHFEGKKLQWLQNFMKQYRARGLPIHHPEVVAAQAVFKSALKQTQAETSASDHDSRAAA